MNVIETVASAIGHSLSEGFAMFWETLWALVLGFALAGAVQAFISRGRMQRALGDHRPGTLGKASVLGMVSSSCSYAATALAKTLFARGADFTAAMVFMFASTNLVVELGIVLWLLLGWQFALAEFVGGAIMIVLLGLVVPRVIPPAWIEQAREHLDQPSIQPPHSEHDEHDEHDDSAHGSHEHSDEPQQVDERAVLARMRTRGGWSDAAAYTVSDLSMLRKELLIGYVVAGFATVLVPVGVWQSLFLTGHGFASSLENVVLGPVLAVIAFVCSVGNVPLAAALWSGGISFGGVIAFVFADLITLPLLLIYRKYYGTRFTLRLLGVFWAIMAVAGLAVQYLFAALGILPSTHPAMPAMTGIAWNYTTWLNILALVGFAVLYWLYRTRERHGGGVGYAKDPVCGMQVETVNAPTTATHRGHRIHFCSDACREAFDADPDAYLTTPGAAASTSGASGHEVDGPGPGRPGREVDPVCGMSVDPATAEHTAGDGAGRMFFCSPGCREAYRADPDRYPAAPRSGPGQHLTGGELMGSLPTDHPAVRGTTR